MSKGLSKAQERAAKAAQAARVYWSLQDKAKQAIIQFMETNPHCSPEALKQFINHSLRHFGLHNRYHFTKEGVVDIKPRQEEQLEGATNDPNLGGVEAASSD